MCSPRTDIACLAFVATAIACHGTGDVPSPAADTMAAAESEAGTESTAKSATESASETETAAERWLASVRDAIDPKRSVFVGEIVAKRSEPSWSPPATCDSLIVRVLHADREGEFRQFDGLEITYTDATAGGVLGPTRTPELAAALVPFDRLRVGQVREFAIRDPMPFPLSRRVLVLEAAGRPLDAQAYAIPITAPAPFVRSLGREGCSVLRATVVDTKQVARASDPARADALRVELQVQESLWSSSRIRSGERAFVFVWPVYDRDAHGEWQAPATVRLEPGAEGWFLIEDTLVPCVEDFVPLRRNS